MTNEIKDKILSLQRDGLKYQQIAPMLGLPANTVRMFLIRYEERYRNRCPLCEKEIIQQPHRKGKKFCSDQCRRDWWNHHPAVLKRKAYYNFVCPYCGKEFVAYGNKNRKYCSRRCYADARREETN